MRSKVRRAGVGRELIVGIRPEHFEDAALLNGKRDEGLTFAAVVDVLESLGADKYAYFRLKGARATAQELEELAADAGTRDAPGGSDQVVARLDPASQAHEGRQLQLWFDPTSCTCSTPTTGPTSPSEPGQPAGQRASRKVSTARTRRWSSSASGRSAWSGCCACCPPCPR